MPPEYQFHKSNLLLHVLTMLMTGIVAYGYLLLEGEDAVGSLYFVMNVILQIGMMIAGGWYCRTSFRNIGESPVIMPILVMVMLGSYLYEYVERWYFGVGHPFEFLVTCSLKNVMLASAAAGCWLPYQRLAAAGSFFIMLFCLTVCTHQSMVIIAVTYVLIALSWLVLSYWQQLALHLRKQEEKKSPIYTYTLIGVILLLIISTLSFKNQEVIHALQGFMPTSGGSHHHDHHARGGVGDGDALVAGKEHIQSFAPLEDAPFKSSEEPSLYDVFDDTYDEPACPIHKRKSELAIPLPPQFSKQIPQEMAKSKQLNRTFSTLRTATKTRPQKMKDLDSHAIFYLSGRTPLHLRMQTYELFDGQDWHSQEWTWENRQHNYQLKEIMGRNWLNIPFPSKGFSEAFCPEETHAIKVINLHSNRIPAPLNLRGVHFDKLNNPEFFVLEQSDIVAMNREKIPEMQPIHLSSCVFNPEELRKYSVGHGKHGDINLVVPELKDMESIKLLADKIAFNKKFGWEQIDAIISYLKTEYVHDRKTLVSDISKIEKGEIPCADFLFKSKKGPDYQFATAAVLMLRSQGYAARLVSGFYASPENYKTKSKHTEVYVKDAHFWVELYVGAGIWCTLEPTPGYEILGPPPTPFQIVLAAFLQVGYFLKDQFLLLSIIFGSSSVVYLNRGHLMNFYFTEAWKYQTYSSLKQYILETQKLLIKRFELYDLEPYPSETINSWLKRIPFDQTAKEQLLNFSKLTDWSRFSSSEEKPPLDSSESEVKELLKQMIKYWSLSKIQSLKKYNPQQTHSRFNFFLKNKIT